jgi:hypothetical protein
MRTAINACIIQGSPNQFVIRKFHGNLKNIGYNRHKEKNGYPGSLKEDCIYKYYLKYNNSRYTLITQLLRDI